MQFSLATVKKRSIHCVMEVPVINLITNRNIFYILHIDLFLIEYFYFYFSNP
jgi:hypothetical protein